MCTENKAHRLKGRLSACTNILYSILKVTNVYGWQVMIINECRLERKQIGKSFILIVYWYFYVLNEEHADGMQNH